MIEPKSVTIAHCRHAESRALDHRRHGRLNDAKREYDNAATLWGIVADRAARYGETAISNMFRQEAEKNVRKRGNIVWDMLS